MSMEDSTISQIGLSSVMLITRIGRRHGLHLSEVSTVKIILPSVLRQTLKLFPSHPKRLKLKKFCTGKEEIVVPINLSLHSRLSIKIVQATGLTILILILAHWQPTAAIPQERFLLSRLLLPLQSESLILPEQTLNTSVELAL